MDLARNYEKIAEVNHALNEFHAALAAEEQASVVRQKLLGKCKERDELCKSDEWRGREIDLARNYSRIAEINIELNEFNAARAAAEQARTMLQELLAGCKEPHEGCKEDEERKEEDRLRKIDAQITTIEGRLGAIGGPSR